MAVFPSRKFIPTGAANSAGARYRAAMARHPFLLFGLPFLTVIIAGSFVLTPATAIRYERHDRKVRQMSREEELGLKNNSRKVDMREEYYVGCLPSHYLQWSVTDQGGLAETASERLGQLGAETSQATAG
jgi:cytochrome c oxidase assembly protein subunit 16